MVSPPDIKSKCIFPHWIANIPHEFKSAPIPNPNCNEKGLPKDRTFEGTHTSELILKKVASNGISIR
jgi:hypothetical protein